MNLKNLKKNATVSELSLIEMVEKLVRYEYDEVRIRKEIHDDLKTKMYNEVTKVLELHNCLKKMNNDRSYYTYGDRIYLRNIICEIGDALRLELKTDDKKI